MTRPHGLLVPFPKYGDVLCAEFMLNDLPRTAPHSVPGQIHYVAQQANAAQAAARNSRRGLMFMEHNGYIAAMDHD